jgi:flavin-dependent dehydrogenase
VRLDAIAIRIGGETVVVPEPGCGAIVRRIEFDHAFARVAMARGIEIREGCEVTGIAVVTGGVTIATADGSVHARAIVGADGVGGIVRRAAGFPRGELRAQVVELDTEAADGDLPRDTAVFDFQTTALRGYAWDFPSQVAGAPVVCRGVYVIRTLGPDEPRTRLAAYLASRGLDIARYRVKQFAERGLEPDAAISAPRVLLAGEAAGIDIATGEGIGQAIEYGAVAGPYLAAALDRDELGFADWRAVIDRHHLGFQMRVRHWCYRWFYGHRRAKIAKLMPRLPALFALGVQDFAGVPLSALAMARGAGQFVAAYTRAKLT